MSLASTTSSVSGSGNGTTFQQFPVTFQFFDASDLTCYWITSAGVSTKLTSGTHYTVSQPLGVDNQGTVILAGSFVVPTGDTLLVVRSTALTQKSSFTTGDRFPAKSTEQALDKLTMMVQDKSRNTLPDSGATSGASPFVLGLSATGGSPAWVSQTASNIKPGSITADLLSSGHPTWDGSGNLTATSFVGPVTGNVSGNATSATSAAKLTTARTLAVTGDVAGSASFDGSANASISATIQTGSVTVSKLGTTEQKQIAKAWVNFNGNTNGTWAGGASTVSRTAGSTTATITTTNPHGLVAGNIVYVLTGVAANSYAVLSTGLTNTQFQITTVATTVLNSAAITFQVLSIRNSHNVSSIAVFGTGQYYVNFATPMGDDKYCVTVSKTTTAGVAYVNIGTVTSGYFSIGSRYYNGSASNGIDEDYIFATVFSV